MGLAAWMELSATGLLWFRKILSVRFLISEKADME
jgi:hypothetical protein